MPKLFVVPTPIGNLEDITLRAIRVLKEVNLILAEDTRTTGMLLKHYSISNKLRAYHKFNEHKISLFIEELFAQSDSIALVSDAGTPGISDPGFLLVRTCIEKGIDVDCLPGATAFVPALVNSGLPTDSFIFEGFLPVKKGRQTKFKEIATYDKTIVLYESPHRILKTLLELGNYLGENRRVSVSREISKMFEETFRGTLKEAHAYFSSKSIKGEFVVIIAGEVPKVSKEPKVPKVS